MSNIVRAVLHETLRVFPPVHTTLRASGEKATVIPLTKSPGARGGSGSQTGLETPSKSSDHLSSDMNPNEFGSAPQTPPTPDFSLPSSTAPSPLASPSSTQFTQSELPFYVPPHTNVSLVPLLIHRRRDTWGPDSHIFDPDRWLDQRMGRVLKNPMMFTPFNAGPRIVSLLSSAKYHH
jgi:hypothetical protein